jgi:molybdate-binding protein/transcriptional regulator with XRE-family HTH domain
MIRSCRYDDMMLSTHRPLPNRVKTLREQRGWSQGQLAAKTGISRAAVSAIEIQRLVPSVASALALAAALDCTVEVLFGMNRGEAEEMAWAWPPRSEPCRFWRARIGGRILHFPSEPTVAGILPHDGQFRRGTWHLTRESNPERTLVMASCDPAAGLLAREYERATGFLLIPLQRGSREALELLHRGLVDVAGIHLATAASDRANARAARAILGAGFVRLRFATWDDGLAVSRTTRASSVASLLQSKARWVGREIGTGARECQDEILGERRVPRRIAKDHRGVAVAIRCDWADVGVCLRLVAELADLRFIKVREEAYDLCFPASLAADPRLSKLVATIRSPAFKTLFPLPGYHLSRAVEFGRI